MSKSDSGHSSTEVPLNYLSNDARLNFEGGINEEMRHRYREIQAKLAYYRGEKVRLEGYKKIITAKLQQEAGKIGIVSQSERKVYAEAHNDQIQLNEALADTEVMISVLWSEVDLFSKDVEVWRSKQANKRFEQSSY